VSDTRLRDIGIQVAAALAQIVGGLLAVFGGGCVVAVAVMSFSGEDFVEWLPSMLLAGVVPLAIGITLFRWGAARAAKRRADGPRDKGPEKRA
jgi:hypothetical protein